MGWWQISHSKSLPTVTNLSSTIKIGDVSSKLIAINGPVPHIYIAN